MVAVKDLLGNFDPEDIKVEAFAHNTATMGKLLHLCIDADINKTSPMIGIALTYQITPEQFTFIAEHSRKEK